MTDIQFYHLTSTPLERALPKLLEKAFAGGFRSLVLVESEEKAEWLAGQLWSYDPASFLPHGTRKDGSGEAQPIYITSEPEFPNKPDLLVITDGSRREFGEGFKRVLDIFDGGDESAIAKARGRWKQYQSDGHNVSYIKQNASGGWEKQSA